MFLGEVSRTQKEVFLDLLYDMMTADGKMEEKEVKMFERFRHECLLSKEDYKVGDKPIKESLEKLNKFEKKVQKIIVLELYGMMLVDGLEHKNETELMEKIVSYCGLSQYDNKRIKQWVQTMNEMLMDAYVMLEM